MYLSVIRCKAVRSLDVFCVGSPTAISVVAATATAITAAATATAVAIAAATATTVVAAALVTRFRAPYLHAAISAGRRYLSH